MPRDERKDTPPRRPDATAERAGDEEHPLKQAALRRRLIARKAEGPAEPAAIPRGSGAPLDESVRRPMEKHLGADLSAVRVHTGADSARAASQLGARAFTVDHDVHFGGGQLAPGSEQGDKLIAHELTHVVQGQRGGVQRKASDTSAVDGVSQPGDPAEREADDVADSVAARMHGAARETRPLAIRAGQAPIARAADATASTPATPAAHDGGGVAPAAKDAAAPAAKDPAATKDGATTPAGPKAADATAANDPAAKDGGDANAKQWVADDNCHVNLAEPVETRVSSVDAARQPWFDASVSLSFEQLAASMDLPGVISDAELHAVASISLAATPSKSSTLQSQVTAGGIQLAFSHFESFKSLEVTSVNVKLASGKSFNLILKPSQFHCDNQVWERDWRQREIQDRQAQNADMLTKDAAAQKVIDGPPPPPDAGISAQIADELAQIDQCNQTIVKHTAELRQGFRDEDPVIEAFVLEIAKRDPANAKLLDYGQRLSAVAEQRSTIAGSLEALEQAVIKARALGPPEAAAQAQQQLTDAQQKRDALTQQLLSIRAEMMAEVDKDAALDAELIAILDKQNGGLLANTRNTIEWRQKIVASLRVKLDDAAKEPKLDAQQTIAVHQPIVQQNNEAIAKLQAELKALTGPVYVMFDAGGKPLPPPKP
jgi:hypothetical protein